MESVVGAVLGKAEIERRLDKDLFIRPLLETSQISATGIDLRLGYDFLVSIHGRDAYINASYGEIADDNRKGIKHLFQETRRQIGETFILHPSQTVLASSLEYVQVPEDIMLLVNLRSSYNRLGLSLSTLVQPGYCGCLSIELTNTNFTPVNITVGARLIQVALLKVEGAGSYFTKPRKYSCQVRPETSGVMDDKDLIKLNAILKLSRSI